MESLSANGRRDRSSTDIVIIGGGVVGVLAAMRMRERDVEYRIIERHSDLGGTWHTHSNNYSTAQVAFLYRLIYITTMH
jgi:4-hydroxyacetophenone monooxygenase